MGVSVEFGTTSDPVNKIRKSTSLGQAVTCELKVGTSVEAPEFIVTDGNVSSTDNYAHCSDLGRYYFIIDIILAPDGTHVICSVDPLMSHADEILAETKLYNIERSEHRDVSTTSGMLVDGQLNQLNQMDVKIIKAPEGIPISAAGNTARRYVLILV